MCYECFQNAGELAKGEDLGEVHVDTTEIRVRKLHALAWSKHSDFRVLKNTPRTLVRGVFDI